MKIFISLGWLLLFAVSCQKQEARFFPDDPSMASHKQQIAKAPLRCGVKFVAANAGAHTKMAAIQTAPMASVPADELLVYLDFDGAAVSPGQPDATGYKSSIILRNGNCPAPDLSRQQLDQIVERVADDFSPFNIRVTTDYNAFLAYPVENKQITILTTLPNVVGFSSGVNGVAPFSAPGVRKPGDPAFVFTVPIGDNLEEIASIISHETGHCLGLAHQNYFDDQCTQIGEYHPGIGEGPLSFCPIMGSADKRVSNWYAQTCINSFWGVALNDFELIHKQVRLVEDDYPDFIEKHAALTSPSVTGVLGVEGDIDFIRMHFKKPTVLTVASENIDLKVSVYTNGGKLTGVYNDPDDTGVTLPRLSGNRILKVEAVDNAYMSSRFMTGRYYINGAGI
ncbi:M57 family metalloprotease [Niabella aurantiaca]|uniref:M57 family metalloprotease n=1 Tax=Niabella aurantiaca TaxID=379900 RepID=UPI00037B0D57|nr:M57 family metalloprotease [Niabella aurantiaca]